MVYSPRTKVPTYAPKMSLVIKFVEIGAFLLFACSNTPKPFVPGDVPAMSVTFSGFLAPCLGGLGAGVGLDPVISPIL